MDAQNVKSTDLKGLAESLFGVIKTTEADPNGIGDSIIYLLGVPDDQFEVLAPGILQAYQQTVNNPNDKLALAQTLNAMGTRAEDLNATFEVFAKQIDESSFSKVKRDFLKQLIGSTLNAINETEGISKRTIQVPIELCHENAKIPQYAHISDSGLDVYALDDITIHPGETALIPTGFKVAIPVGYELQVRPKSGRALKTKLRVANTPGTIDQGYRDEVKIIIDNIEPPIKDITINEEGLVTSILYGGDFTIGKGEKFCQLVLAETPKVAFYRVDSVKDIGEDRGGGFGSTDLK